VNNPDDRREPPAPAPAEVFHGDEIDETFDGRLKQAIVRHFRFEWRELIALRDRARSATPKGAPPDRAGVGETDAARGDASDGSAPGAAS